jgi:hypothetical protein
MSQTVVGYNRDFNTGNTTQVLGAGSTLLDKNGNNVVLPAGNVVVELELKRLVTTGHPTSAANADAVEVRVGSFLLCRYTFADISNSDYAAYLGTGTSIAPTPSFSTNQDIKLYGVQVGVGGANLDFPPLPPPLSAPVEYVPTQFSCLVKYKPMPLF